MISGEKGISEQGQMIGELLDALWSFFAGIVLLVVAVLLGAAGLAAIWFLLFG